jgi:hypothetical protein
VIVITLSRPIVESELNILLKVKEGSATHIQQVKAPLTRGRSNVPAPMSNALVKEKPLTLKSSSVKRYCIKFTNQHAIPRDKTPEVVTPPAMATKATTTTDSAGTLAINVIAPPHSKQNKNNYSCDKHTTCSYNKYSEPSSKQSISKAVLRIRHKQRR